MNDELITKEQAKACEFCMVMDCWWAERESLGRLKQDKKLVEVAKQARLALVVRAAKVLEGKREEPS